MVHESNFKIMLYIHHNMFISVLLKLILTGRIMPVKLHNCKTLYYFSYL